MDKLVSWFESFAIAVLMILVMVTVVFAGVIITGAVYHDIISAREFSSDPKALLDTFGLFVVVLVGIELLKILKHLWESHQVDTALIAETALIALCNKIVTMNFVDVNWTTLLAVAVLIVSLVAAIFVLGRNKHHE